MTIRFNYNYTSEIYLNISKICISVTIRFSSMMKNLFDYFIIFLPSATYFTKQITVTHRSTSISHVICFEFAFTPVCIVSDRRLFVHKGNLSCMIELQFSRNHNYVTNILKTDYRDFQNLLDSGLEYCYQN